MNPSFSAPFFDVAQVALHHVTQAYQSHPGPLNAGIHALYGLVHGEPSLKRQFLNVFLGQMLDDLEHYATNGLLSDLSKHQTLLMIYHDVPQVEAHRKSFLRHIKEYRYPWVQSVVRKMEAGIALGLQAGQEFHLCRMLQDLHRYIDVTGGGAPFVALHKEAKRRVVDYYRERLYAQQTPFEFLQRQQELNRLISCMERMRVQDCGCKDLWMNIIADPKYASWIALIADYDALEALKEKKACLIEAQLGARVIRDRIKLLEEGVPMARGGEKDLEIEQQRLGQILAYALEGNVGSQLEQTILDVEWQKNKLSKRLEAC